MPTKPFLVYVVEDNEWYNRLLVHSLSHNPDLEIKSFVSGEEMLKEITHNPQIITIDYRLPDMNGQELLTKIKNHNNQIEVIVISEQEDIETAVELLKLGAFDYIVKSKDIRDRLLNVVSHINNNASLKKEIVSLKKEVQKKYNFSNTIIGKSDSIKQTFELIEKSLNNNISVSILGETGTGKEVTAKAIHFNSKFKDGPFVAVNMAAIPSELFESELFGHEKGAFTGALTRRVGKFEEANGGTLFLDEIGELDINSQAKLLRALQEKEVTRVGSNKSVKINCRIIVATNRNLLEEVKEKKFREDLYYRLIGINITLPPLRERGNDVVILANFFIKNFCKENEMPIKGLSPEAKNKLLSYSWPGNIRELKSVIELATVMSVNDEITANDITLDNEDIAPDILTGEITMREYNRRIIAVYMKRYNNDTKKVADKLDIGQTTVYRMLKEAKEND